jgi:hypothetical protein
MAFYRPKSLGCCSTGSARPLGQLDEGALTAVLPEFPPTPDMPLRSLFAVSVGAGLTVWAITKWLSTRK